MVNSLVSPRFSLPSPRFSYAAPSGHFGNSCFCLSFQIQLAPLAGIITLLNKVLYFNRAFDYPAPWRFGALVTSNSHMQTNSHATPLPHNFFASAARFWEPRRLLYNLILLAVVILWIVLTWPHFRPAFVPVTLLPLSFLALLANVCYTMAYLVEAAFRYSKFTAAWIRYRWVLWLLGMLLALLLENYWIVDEIYPDFH
jgi:hypothetical protein